MVLENWQNQSVKIASGVSLARVIKGVCQRVFNGVLENYMLEGLTVGDKGEASKVTVGRSVDGAHD